MPENLDIRLALAALSLLGISGYMSFRILGNIRDLSELEKAGVHVPGESTLV